MTREDIKVIKYAKAISEYCGNKARCENNCPLFDGGCLLLDDNCRFPSDWNIPKVKTYKQDFLDKFPDADFNADCICRKYVYPNSGEHPNCNNDKCEQCWNETYITDRTEERSK